MKPKILHFLNKNELGRLATASKGGTPHVTAVVYAMDGENIVIVTDYGTKKLKNLRENPQAALLVDTNNSRTGVLIQGKCAIYERGKEYVRLLDILFKKFEFYRKDPWGEGESPILKISPDKVVPLGL